MYKYQKRKHCLSLPFSCRKQECRFLFSEIDELPVPQVKNRTQPSFISELRAIFGTTEEYKNGKGWMKLMVLSLSGELEKTETASVKMKERISLCGGLRKKNFSLIKMKIHEPEELSSDQLCYMFMFLKAWCCLL